MTQDGREGHERNQEIREGVVRIFASDEFEPINEEEAAVLGVNDGRCVNLTGENLGVYGPKHPTDTSRYETSLYVLPTQYQTPDDWDCDGVFIPNDRIGDQTVGSDVQGPAAIKYIGPLRFTITKSGNKYALPPNQGAFGRNDVCCPSNWPTCVCWPIPDIPQSSVVPEDA